MGQALPFVALAGVDLGGGSSGSFPFKGENIGQALPFVALAGAQVATGYMQSRSITAAGKAEQSIANFNARMSEVMAEDALKRGDEDANTVRGKARRVRGSQRVALAGQGVELDSGTALDLQDDTQTLSEQDVLTVKNNAWREAFGYRVQAADYSMRGKFARESARMNSRNTLLTSGLSAGKSLIQAFG